jgi:hypothetical protein
MYNHTISVGKIQEEKGGWMQKKSKHVHIIELDTFLINTQGEDRFA